MDLIDSLIQNGWLKTSRIIDAFREIKRADFMFTRRSLSEGEPDLEKLAEINLCQLVMARQSLSH